MSDYPEHDKLHAVAERSQAVGEFLDFSGFTLCRWDADDECFWPVPGSIERLLAAYYGIDLDAIDREKRAMLDAIRTAA